MLPVCSVDKELGFNAQVCFDIVPSLETYFRHKYAEAQQGYISSSSLLRFPER